MGSPISEPRQYFGIEIQRRARREGLSFQDSSMTEFRAGPAFIAEVNTLA